MAHTNYVLQAIGSIAAIFCLSSSAAAVNLPLAGGVLTSFTDAECRTTNGGPDGLGTTCQHWGGVQNSFHINDLFVNTKDCSNLSLHWYNHAKCTGTAAVVYRKIQANKCYQYLTHGGEWVQLVCNNPNL